MTEELVIVVVANKSDLASRREVPEDQAREYVTRVLGPETPLYEVSAKEDDGKVFFLKEKKKILSKIIIIIIIYAESV